MANDGCEQGKRGKQLESLFHQSLDALMQRVDRDRQHDMTTILPPEEEITISPEEEAELWEKLEAEEPTSNVIHLNKWEAQCRLNEAINVAESLDGKIEKPGTFNDTEVTKQMIEDAALRWEVSVKEVEMYIWDLHNRGASYQFIRSYLMDVED